MFPGTEGGHSNLPALPGFGPLRESQSLRASKSQPLDTFSDSCSTQAHSAAPSGEAKAINARHILTRVTIGDCHEGVACGGDVTLQCAPLQLNKAVYTGPMLPPSSRQFPSRAQHREAQADAQRLIHPAATSRSSHRQIFQKQLCSAR